MDIKIVQSYQYVVTAIDISFLFYYHGGLVTCLVQYTEDEEDTRRSFEFESNYFLLKHISSSHDGFLKADNWYAGDFSEISFVPRPYQRKVEARNIPELGDNVGNSGIHLSDRIEGSYWQGSFELVTEWLVPPILSGTLLPPTLSHFKSMVFDVDCEMYTEGSFDTEFL